MKRAVSQSGQILDELCETDWPSRFSQGEPCEESDEESADIRKKIRVIPPARLEWKFELISNEPERQ
jgi:hypothetical protein